MNVERRTASSHPAGLAGVIAGLLAVTTLTTSLTGSASALMVRRRAPLRVAVSTSAPRRPRMRWTP